MARYVTLRFEDNQAADEFISSIQRDDRWDGGGLSKMRVTGLFAIPTKFCECEGFDQHLNPRAIVRGEKLGWWVHRDCARPYSLGFQTPRNLIPGAQESTPEVIVSWTFRNVTEGGPAAGRQGNG